MNFKGRFLNVSMKQDIENTNTFWVFEIHVLNTRVAYMTGNDGLLDHVSRRVLDLGMAIHLRLPHCYKWFDGITTEHLDDIWKELGEFVASYCGSHTLQKYKECRSKLVMIGSTHQKEGELTNPLVFLPSNVWINTIYIPKAKGWVDVAYELTRHPEQHTDLVTTHPGNHADDAWKRTKESLRRGVRSFKWVMRRSLHIEPAHGLRFVPVIGDVYLKHQDEIHRVLDIPLAIGELNMSRVDRQIEESRKEHNASTTGDMDIGELLNYISNPAVTGDQAQAAAAAMITTYLDQMNIKDDSYQVATVLGDMVADMLHLCERHGLDFESAIESGRRHFNNEQ